MRNRIALIVLSIIVMAIVAPTVLLPASASVTHPRNAPVGFVVPASGPAVASITSFAFAQAEQNYWKWITTAVANEQAAEAAATAAAAARLVQERAQAAQAQVAAHAAASNPAPTGGGGWAQVAICEEGGSNSATYGYFGILPSTWAGHDGVSTAGQDSYANQVAYANQINGGHAPWCPPNCSAGGYRGW